MALAFFIPLLLALTLASAAFADDPNTNAFVVSNFIRNMGGNAGSYLAASPVCTWKPITCDPHTGDVIGLDASGIGLSGAIPPDTVGKLTKLQSLDLSRNSITAIGSDLWGLGGTLRALNLSGNRIAGPLPENVANFGKMESLDLSDNQFSGEIPVGLGALSGLQVLNLGGNMFEGSVPDAVFGLRKLSYLNVSSNSLRGSFLAGRILSTMRVIDLNNNRFEGSVSELILNSSFDLSSLVYLDVSGNQLTGELSGNWGRVSSLKHLSLASNRFSHQQFPDIHKLSGLEYLNLSQTEIAGGIPDEISSLVSLHTLDLSHNRLTGKIPDLNSGNLVRLDLSANNLTGEVPQSLQTKLSGMEHFNFSYNNLSLCAANISPETFAMAFIGSQDDCPIAANTDVVRKEKKHRGVILALAIALSCCFLAVGLVIISLGLRNRSRSFSVRKLSYGEEKNISGPFSFQADSTKWVADVKLATSVPVVIFEKPLLNFTFADLLSATSHFDRATLLAEGRFGPVYRGFLPEGVQIAVKVLVNGSRVTDQEAARELERLGQIKHPNLVPLIGYCLAGDQRIAIYDYMENGNLQNLLHNSPLGVQTAEDWSNDTWEEDNDGIQSITREGMTTWRFRHKIALGMARALAFLHHGCFPQIVHRDVKASSIYLDSAFEPRLSDFGLEKVVGSSLEGEIYRDSLGYAPPEFFESETAAATTKSDVYGFGVILFELITMKKPLVDDEYPEEDTTLVGWARALVRNNQALTAIDPRIRQTSSDKQMEDALRIAYLCTADLPSKRPSMQQIVGLLKDIEPAISDQ